MRRAVEGIALFDEQWLPKAIAEMNDCQFRALRAISAVRR